MPRHHRHAFTSSPAAPVRATDAPASPKTHDSPLRRRSRARIMHANLPWLPHTATPPPAPLRTHSPSPLPEKAPLSFPELSNAAPERVSDACASFHHPLFHHNIARRSAARHGRSGANFNYESPNSPPLAPLPRAHATRTHTTSSQHRTTPARTASHAFPAPRARESHPSHPLPPVKAAPERVSDACAAFADVAPSRQHRHNIAHRASARHGRSGAGL